MFISDSRHQMIIIFSLIVVHFVGDGESRQHSYQQYGNEKPLIDAEVVIYPWIGPLYQHNYRPSSFRDLYGTRSNDERNRWLWTRLMNSFRKGNNARPSISTTTQSPIGMGTGIELANNLIAAMGVEGMKRFAELVANFIQPPPGPPEPPPSGPLGCGDITGDLPIFGTNNGDKGEKGGWVQVPQFPPDFGQWPKGEKGDKGDRGDCSCQEVTTTTVGPTVPTEEPITTNSPTPTTELPATTTTTETNTNTELTTDNTGQTTATTTNESTTDGQTTTDESSNESTSEQTPSTDGMTDGETTTTEWSTQTSSTDGLTDRTTDASTTDATTPDGTTETTILTTTEGQITTGESTIMTTQEETTTEPTDAPTTTEPMGGPTTTEPINTPTTTTDAPTTEPTNAETTTTEPTDAPTTTTEPTDAPTTTEPTDEPTTITTESMGGPTTTEPTAEPTDGPTTTTEPTDATTTKEPTDEPTTITTESMGGPTTTEPTTEPTDGPTTTTEPTDATTTTEPTNAETTTTEPTDAPTTTEPTAEPTETTTEPMDGPSTTELTDATTTTTTEFSTPTDGPVSPSTDQTTSTTDEQTTTKMSTTTTRYPPITEPVVVDCGETIIYENATWQSSNLFDPELITPNMCVLTIKLNSSNKMEEHNEPICQIRLDFKQFTIAQPNRQGNCFTDNFKIFNAENNIPTICGDNPGQHLYLKPRSGAKQVRLAYKFGLSSVRRFWNIRITLVPCCANHLLAPPDCLQYFNDYRGIVKSFNWIDSPSAYTASNHPRQLANQHYNICFEANSSAKTICYTPCQTTGLAFSISQNALRGPYRAGVGVTDCRDDFLLIANGYDINNKSQRNDRFCGTIFNPNGNVTVNQAYQTAEASTTICSDIKPFQFHYTTNMNELPLDVANNGFCLEYKQDLTKNQPLISDEKTYYSELEYN